MWILELRELIDERNEVEIRIEIIYATETPSIESRYCSGIAKHHICSKLRESIEHKQLIYFYWSQYILNCINMRRYQRAEREWKNGTI